MTRVTAWEAFLSFLRKLHQGQLSISSHLLTLIYSFFIITFCNFSLWSDALHGHGADPHPASPLLAFVLYLVLIIVLNTLLSIVSFKYLLKPILIVVLFIAAGTAHFLDNYGVMIDKNMIRNVMQTDVHESGELLTTHLLVYMLLLAVIPSYVISRLKISYHSFFKELAIRVVTALVLLLFAGALMWSQYQDLASFIRNNRYLRFVLDPSAPIYYSFGYLRGDIHKGPIVLKKLGTDAHKGKTLSESKKKLLTIVVVGEAARAQEFSLDGYPRQTNPELSKLDVASFKQFSSCGTETAVSVPCMFSIYNRSDYSYEKGISTENVVDVLKHAGFNLLWRDNDGGSKAVADRIKEIDVDSLGDTRDCKDGMCRDDALLYKLQDYLDKQTGDTVIFLHQKGSHGPAYYRRVPEAYTQFKPICKSASFSDCSRQQIINSYDNTILYTDHQLARVIDFLKKNEGRFNSSMLYLSDHGESTGEHGIYLHGTPYMFAPSQQTHIPFIAWFSPGYKKEMGLNMQCVNKLLNKPFSQDNLFHTLLGVTDVKSKVYQPEMDIFRECRQ
ncbi:phosphoethanolamine transferase [Dongshaea marina]|uniref:phosphoethanolamine transferase n=1 Tax=Dongshaea marina TaxID=2047966 RepID=UPI000D3ECB2A|nr:phosphoethanolamine--lipid A transferase [Dongshaea marina]